MAIGRDNYELRTKSANSYVNSLITVMKTDALTESRKSRLEWQKGIEKAVMDVFEDIAIVLEPVAENTYRAGDRKQKQARKRAIRQIKNACEELDILLDEGYR